MNLTKSIFHLCAFVTTAFFYHLSGYHHFLFWRMCSTIDMLDILFRVWEVGRGRSCFLKGMSTWRFWCIHLHVFWGIYNNNSNDRYIIIKLQHSALDRKWITMAILEVQYHWRPLVALKKHKIIFRNTKSIIFFQWVIMVIFAKTQVLSNMCWCSFGEFEFS